MDLDVAIIGAGLSGLAAGIRLAHYGKRVCIFERHAAIGGLNSCYSRPGWELDVGLHAMTNCVPADVRGAPLNKLLRQLRLRQDDLRLVPQAYSAIRFPGSELRFTNRFAEFQASVASAFPHETEGFQRLVRAVEAFDAFSLAEQASPSARRVLAGFLHDPLLTDMLLCPLMYYGNAMAGDMDFAQFCVMFRSIFQEGFCRPAGGMREVLGLIESRYRDCGGQVRLRCGVRRLGLDGDRVRCVQLDDRSEVRARAVLSCAGVIETLRLCEPPLTGAELPPEGWFSVVELIAGLDCPATELGVDTAIVFYSHSPAFRFEPPTVPVDHGSGVLCAPANFAFPGGMQPRPMLRLTNMADPQYWLGLAPAEYRQQKKALVAAQLVVLDGLVPGARDHAVFLDAFTPRTIARYTGHINGAVYGSPRKCRDGRTPLSNLYLCGTDQGFLGITGSMLSGVSIANAYLLA